MTLLNTLNDTLLKPLPDLSGLSAEEQFDIIVSKAADGDSIVNKESLLERLKESKKTGKPLKFKLGADPTGPELHLGHAVSLINLRRYLAMGHHVDFIVGDFTAMVGDASGSMSERPALTKEDVAKNMASYKEQASKILDFDKVSLHYNSTWSEKINLAEWLALTKRISVSSLVQREDFRKRLEGGIPLSLAEFEYALLMGYDSVALETDVEVGGYDQFLNFHFCRDVMGAHGMRKEEFITYNLIAGTTGEVDDQGRYIKMSKSKGNYIPMAAEPADMYGKTMSIPDNIMWVWFRELTEITPTQLEQLKADVEAGKIHPRDAKMLLARAIVASFNNYDADVVAAAEAAFTSKFGGEKKLIPDDVITAKVTAESGSLLDVLAGLTGRSKGDLRRTAAGQGVRVLDEAAEDYIAIDEATLTTDAANHIGKTLRVGKRAYFTLQ